MGDTAPPQAPASGLGAAPGAGLLGGGSAAAPRVHSAIVERLRARIAVCRRHHRSCEGRYERGRAESSDRERQSTRQLLSLVQHGQATRKATKPARAAPPPDYARPHLPDAERPPPAAPTAAAGDPRNSALLALQGSLRRKQTLPSAPAHSKRPNGFAHGDFLDIKRICVGEAPGPGQGPLQANSGQSPLAPGVLPLSQAPAQMPAAPPAAPLPAEDLSSLGLKPVKKEPGEALSCSRHLDGAFGQPLGEEPAEPLMDPELQELFNELSSISVPPLSDLELESMVSAAIKQGDPFSLDLGQPQSQQQSPGPTLALDKPLIKSEFSPGLGPATSGSPPLRPPPDSPAFSVAAQALPAPAPLSSAPQGQPKPVPGAGRVLPSWQVSHAQQLKQIAASRQQHGQPQLPPQPVAWSALPCTAGAAATTFGQEKTPSPSFTQQPFVPQGSPMPGGTHGSGQPTALGSCVLKAGPPAQATPQENPRGFAGGVHSATKLLFHFSPEPGGQQPPRTLASPSKCLSHYPAVVSSQQPLPGPPLQRPTVFQASPQPRQEQQHSAVGPSPAGSFLSPQPSLLTQQLLGKQPAGPRPLAEQKQQQQMLVDAEKMVTQDQLSRHLSRPPPDYKDQRRNTGSVSSGVPYPGATPTTSLSFSQPVSTQALTTPSPGLLTPAHSTRVLPVSTAVPSQSVGTFASLSCSQPYSATAGLGQLVPQRNLPQLGVGPSGPLAPRPPALAPRASSSSSAPFTAVSVGASPQPRLSLPHGMANLAARRAPTEMLRTSTAAPPGWAPQETSAKPQEAPKPAGVSFPAATPVAYAPNQSLPQVVGGQQFPPAAAAAPKPLAPAVQMRPLSQVNQAVNGQGRGPLRGPSLRPGSLSAPMLPTLSPPAATLSQVSPQALTAGSFPSPGQSSRPFPGPEHSGAGLAFDFLSPQADGLGPTLTSDADFIDSLLKTEPGSDDWMRDINLDEILGSHS